MIKQLIVAASAALLCTGVSAAYKDGTYTGEGKGNASQIQVEVTVASGKITGVKVVKHGETEMLLKAAEKNVSKAIVENEKNGTEGVQGVTGATNSSKGIIEAVNNALKKAQ